MPWQKMKNKQSVRNLILYLLLVVLLLSGVSFLQAVDMSVVDIYYYLSVLLALAIGVMHIIITSKFLFPASSRAIGMGFWLSIAALFLSAVIIGIIYYYAELNIAFMTFIIAFIIPYMCFQAYRGFLKIWKNI
jgi:hypothetical protein